jgi:hypothetical protein
MDFKLNKKQRQVLEQLTLNKKEDERTNNRFKCAGLVYHESERWNGYKPYWIFGDYDPVYKHITLAIVEKLRGLGMVKIYFDKKTKQPLTADLTTSGRNYIESLTVKQEDRLDMDRLHRIHQLVYHPVRHEKKRQKNK